jgi:hypothetical protein
LLAHQSGGQRRDLRHLIDYVVELLLAQTMKMVLALA